MCSVKFRIKNGVKEIFELDKSMIELIYFNISKHMSLFKDILFLKHN